MVITYSAGLSTPTCLHYCTYRFSRPRAQATYLVLHETRDGP